MIDASPLDRVIDVARRLRVPVWQRRTRTRFELDDKHPNFTHAPAHTACVILSPERLPLAVVWNERYDINDLYDSCGLAHEVAHVVVGIDPSEVDETGAMYWIEHEIERAAGVLDGRDRWMADFQIGDAAFGKALTYSELGASSRARVLADAMREAEQAGIAARVRDALGVAA